MRRAHCSPSGGVGRTRGGTGRGTGATPRPPGFRTCQASRSSARSACAAVLDAAAPAFAAANRIAVVREYDSSVALMKRIAAGETADAAVFTASAIDELIAAGKMAARVDLSKSFVGIAVKSGARKPDIATPEKFKAAMLAATSIGRSETGASGLYFGKLVERLGLADGLRGKDQGAGRHRRQARGERRGRDRRATDQRTDAGRGRRHRRPAAGRVAKRHGVLGGRVHGEQSAGDRTGLRRASRPSAAVAPVIRQKGMEPV